MEVRTRAISAAPPRSHREPCNSGGGGVSTSFPRFDGSRIEPTCLELAIVKLGFLGSWVPIPTECWGTTTCFACQEGRKQDLDVSVSSCTRAVLRKTHIIKRA